MKFLLIFFVCCVIYFSSSARAQLPEDTRNYEPMRLEPLLRGSWGLNRCTADLLNCYEMVKGDIICSYGTYYSTVCGYMKQLCDEEKGYQNAPEVFEIKQSICR